MEKPTQTRGVSDGMRKGVGARGVHAVARMGRRQGVWLRALATRHDVAVSGDQWNRCMALVWHYGRRALGSVVCTERCHVLYCWVQGTPHVVDVTEISEERAEVGQLRVMRVVEPR